MLRLFSFISIFAKDSSLKFLHLIGKSLMEQCMLWIIQINLLNQQALSWAWRHYYSLWRPIASEIKWSQGNDFKGVLPWCHAFLHFTISQHQGSFIPLSKAWDIYVDKSATNLGEDKLSQLNFETRLLNKDRPFQKHLLVLSQTFSYLKTFSLSVCQLLQETWCWTLLSSIFKGEYCDLSDLQRRQYRISSYIPTSWNHKVKVVQQISSYWMWALLWWRQLRDIIYKIPSTWDINEAAQTTIQSINN